MDNSDQKKILTHPSLVFAQDLKEICSPLHDLSIAYFSHVRIDAKGHFSALGLEPDFVQLYLEKRYYNYDIHMVQQRLSEQYILWDAIERTKESKALYDDFKKFKLNHTFTIIQENNGTKDCYHFAAKHEHDSINQYYLKSLDLLKKFIYYFNDKINRNKELRRAYEIKFCIEKNYSGYFVENDLWQANDDEFHTKTHLDRIYLDPDRYLTKREIECLYYLAQGNTLEEVAIRLSITLRTVKAHVGRVKEKFCCDNQFQLGMLYQALEKLNMMNQALK